MGSLDLYLIRHGLAGEHRPDADDRERPLTDEGKQKTRQVAKRLQTLGLQFDLVLTSPLVRARQTADILLDARLAPDLSTSDHLAPGGDIHVWLDWLQRWRSLTATALALVGHEPDLSHWSEILLWGQSRGVITLKKAGIIGLTLPNENFSPVGHSSLFWLAPPRFLL